jgi:hypothetical protein
MQAREFILTETVILPESEGGRHAPLAAAAYRGGYRPHIVIEERANRVAKMGIVDGKRQVVDLYQSVLFWEGPHPVPISEPTPITMVLFYAPDQYDYPGVVEGATFTLREGGKIVGHGVVKRRWKEEMAWE